MCHSDDGRMHKDFKSVTDAAMFRSDWHDSHSTQHLPKDTALPQRTLADEQDLGVSGTWCTSSTPDDAPR